MKQVKGKYRRFEDGIPYRLPEDIKNDPNPTPPCPVTDDDIELTKVPKMDVSEFWKYDWHDGVINKDDKTQTGMESEEKERSHGPILDKFIQDGKEHEADQIKKNVQKMMKRGMLSQEEEEEITQRIKNIKDNFREYKEDMDHLGQDLRKKLDNIGMSPEKKPYIKPECEVKYDAVPSDFDGIVDELKALHAKKNHDYGNAAHESYKEFGIISYVIRLNDKMKRLKSLTKPGAEQQVADEKIEDTLMDLAAYAIMAIESLHSNE